MGKKKKSKKRKFRSFFTAKNILIGLIAVLFLVQYFQIQNLVGTFSFLEGRDSSLVTEIGQIKDAYIRFGNDLNEIRDYMGFDTKSYISLDEIENEAVEEGKNQNELQLAMFEYVTYLSSQEELDKKIQTYTSNLNNLGTSESFGIYLSEEELYLSEVVDIEDSVSLNILNNEGDGVFYFYLPKDEAVLYFKNLKSQEEVSTESFEEFEEFVKDNISKNKEDLLQIVAAAKGKTTQIAEAIYSEDTQAALLDLGLTLAGEPLRQDLKMIYEIYNSSSEVAGEIVFDPLTLKITLIDINNQDLSVQATDITTALIPFLEKLDTRTFFDIKVDEAVAELNVTLLDAGFNALLKESGLVIVEPWEDEDRIYYNIFDADGNHLSSFIIEKATGVINIVDPDGTNSENILFFDPEYKKKTLLIPDDIPDYGDEIISDDGSFNILIAGKHGTLVDTMIFTHINEETRTVRMISIPRDLYYNGRKINSFPYYYGMSELKRVLSEMTGYELDKFILIDMYAFIDVIDLVGGIDIHLDNAVIDPTYRTVDDGVVGTLHYEPGDYHLGGVEALRLARTRHTSSDFARAERQQMILEALQDKARNFGFGDADTLYQIAKTVLNQTETDVSLDEAIAYYFRYQNYEIESNNVMSSGNVLYVPSYITVENCNELMAAAEAAGQSDPGCSNQNHAYTLLPRNDNWNVVKWYFRENFEAV
jgi:LCP family protein required for cell wall assembly